MARHLSLPLAGPPAQLGVLPGLLAQASVLRLALLALTLLGFGLRLGLLATFPLREDEAIYAYWALASRSDPLWLDVWPDKPPLYIWLLSASMALFGPTEAGGRWLNIAAGTLTIPLAGLGARLLWQNKWAGGVAALLLTLNPFAISFAPTLYTDPLLTCLGTLAVVLALAGSGGWAGLALGAACMVKQQGVLYVPLVLGLLWWFDNQWFDNRCSDNSRGDPISAGAGPRRRRRRRILWALGGMVGVVAPILVWDALRWAVAPSPWDLAHRTYAPLYVLPPAEWAARGAQWEELLWHFGGSWVVWGGLLAALGAAAWLARRRPRLGVLLVWGAGFLLLHGVTSVQVWDRYLLPLAPWLAMVAGGPLAWPLRFSSGVSRWPGRLPAWLGPGLLALWLLAALPAALGAARGEIPIGGDHGDYHGLREAIAWLRRQPAPYVLYHQALGWHYRFYLHPARTQAADPAPDLTSGLKRAPHGENVAGRAGEAEAVAAAWRWFPSAAYLADNAVKTPYPPKYLVVPDWAPQPDLPLHLAMRGLTWERRLRAGRFTVMEIVQPPRPLCSWCRSAVPEMEAGWLQSPAAPGAFGATAPPASRP